MTKKSVSRLYNHKVIACFLIGLIALFTYFFLPNAWPEATKRASVIFVCAALFWSLEIIPLYATSLSLIVALTFLLTKPGGPLGLGPKGYHLFFIPFSNPVIMLFFGGFVLAKALQKHKIDQLLVTKVIAKVGKNPTHLLAGFLFLTAFLSLWISNTASAAMMLAMILPILKRLDHDDPFRKALPLAIAFGASIGGIGTPIGTPPNALVMGVLAEHGIHLNFLSWMGMALPLALLILAIAVVILRLLFPPKTKCLVVENLSPIRLTKKGKGTIFIGALMVLLWLSTPLHKIPEALTAILGVALFTAFKCLHAKDIKRLDWDILILMWGGLALGEALKVTGTMDVIFQNTYFATHSLSLYVFFCLLAITLSSFMSNTATASLLLPIIVNFPHKEKILLSITVALSCSLALSFPISTPPNALAYGTNTFSVKEMFRAGTPISLLSLLLIFIGFEFFIMQAFSFLF